MFVISLPSKYGPIQKSFCRLAFSIDPADDNDDGAPPAAAADVIAAATPADPPVPTADDDDAVKDDNNVDGCDAKDADDDDVKDDDDNAIDWTISAFIMPSERSKKKKKIVNREKKYQIYFGIILRDGIEGREKKMTRFDK